MFYRRPSTKRDSRAFTEAEKRAVWNKGRVDKNYDPNYVRVDPCGAYMEWENYGNRSSKFGWEIDHIIPVVAGGGDDLSNLQPLQWENNVSKGDGPAYGYCKVG